MCRLYGFRATEPTKVECTLVYAQNALLIQSKADRRGLSHPDGWGIAYFAGDTPSTERRASAAHADVTFSTTAERVHARTVIAHIRRATVGANAIANTHPFQCGRWVFAHNGTVTGFDRLGRELAAETLPPLQRHRHGTTDSEQAFYWLLTRMTRAGIPPDAAAADEDALVAVMAGSITELARRCEQAEPDEETRLNFLLTDGRILLAARWGNTLHWVERDGIHDCEICGIPHVDHHPGHRYRAVVVASEPISHETWQPVPQAQMVVVSADVSCRLQAL